MANYGDLGPTNALIPYEPVPRRSNEVFQDALLQELGLAGRGAARERLKRESDREFASAAGSAESVMTEELFAATAAQLWDFDRRTARACFHAADLDGSGRLNSHEYLLFREAFIHKDREHAEHEALSTLRYRSIFNKYVFGRPAQRCAHEAKLGTAEVLEWIRDLCAGDAHVHRMARKLLPSLLDTEGPGVDNIDGLPPVKDISIDRFVGLLTQGHLVERMRSERLSLNDLVDSFRGRGAARRLHSINRVVFDGRAEFVELPCSRSKRRSRPNDSAAHYGYDIIPEFAVNAEMELDPRLRAVGGWRGPLAPKQGSTEYELAHKVIIVATRWARDVISEGDMLDRDWMKGNAGLEQLFGQGEMQQADAICSLAKACRTQLIAQPTLVRVAAPAKVFGDVHGQLRDLLLLFGLWGLPTRMGGDIQTMSYVFNGDWVDRGAHQLEVVCLLFALKIMYPAQIFLVRGNHEFREMSESMDEEGFLYHIKTRLPSRLQAVYRTVHETFDWLPLAAVISGKVLVLHGGIGDGSWGLDDLEAVQRPLQILEEDLVMEALWSDPSDSDSAMQRGVHSNPERGEFSGIHQFGPDVTAQFCEREGIHLIVRSHQYVRHGYKVMHGGHVVTLFSARNYLADEDNDGAMLLMTPDSNGHLRVHPKRLLKFKCVSSREPKFWTRLVLFLLPCLEGSR